MTVYGSKLKQKTKDIWIVDHDEFKYDIICSGGLIRNIRKTFNVKKIDEDTIIINGGYIANTNTTAVTAKEYNNILYIINDYYIVDSIDKKSGEYRISILDSVMREQEFNLIGESQHIIKIEDLGNKVKIVVGTNRGDIGEVILNTTGRVNIRDIMFSKDKKKNGDKKFCVLCNLEAVTKCMAYVAAMRNIISKSNIYTKQEVATAKIIFAGVYEILMLLNNKDYIGIFANDKVMIRVHDIMRQAIENGLDLYDTRSMAEYKRSARAKVLEQKLRDATGDKEIGFTEINNIIKSLLNLIMSMGTIDRYSLWKRNRHTNVARDIIRESLEKHMKKCIDINTEDSKIEYDICKDMYELLLNNTINTDEQLKQIKITPGYQIAVLDILSWATEHIHTGSIYGFIVNNDNIKSNNKKDIDKNIGTLVSDIDNRIKNCCKQPVIYSGEDTKYFYAWHGSSLVDRDALKIV